MAAKKLLTKKEIHTAAKELAFFTPNKPETKLVAAFHFDSHVSALVFMAKVTVHAEVADHHPDIHFTYQKVKVSLTTHDEKGLTKKDLRLAKKIEKLYVVDRG